MNPFAWIISLFRGPDLGHEYVREIDGWAREFSVGKDWPGETLLEYAYRKYDEHESLRRSLEEKLQQLATTSATLAAFVLSAVGAFDLPVTFWVKLAISFLITSMLVALAARLAHPRPTPPSIHQVLDAAPRSQNPEAWIAANLAKPIAQLRVIQEWAAQQVLVATVLLSLGVTALIPAVFQLSSSPDLPAAPGTSARISNSPAPPRASSGSSKGGSFCG